MKTKTQWGTPIALAIAVVMVGAAYLIPQGQNLWKASNVQADTTDALLKTLATKDSDGDGLPDWEEALYGTDPNKADTFGYGMTDTQAVAAGKIVPKSVAPSASATSSTATSSADVYVPGTAPASGSLTEQFAKTFFAQYLASHGNTPLSTSDMASFVTSAITELQRSQPQQDAFVLSQVKVASSGTEAMRAYAIATEKAFSAQTISAKKSELLYLHDAMANNDDTAIAMIAGISSAYTHLAQTLIAIPAPEELATAHLALANAVAQMGVVTGEFAALKRDPLLTSLGLANYTGDAAALRNAFVNIASLLQKGGVVLKPGDPGYAMESITPATGY